MLNIGFVRPNLMYNYCFPLLLFLFYSQLREVSNNIDLNISLTENTIGRHNFKDIYIKAFFNANSQYFCHILAYLSYLKNWK